MAADLWCSTSVQIRDLLARRKHSLGLEDFNCLDSLLQCAVEVDAWLVPAEVVQESQLPRMVAALLKRVLQQHKLRTAGWEHAAYRKMVTKTAQALTVVFACATHAGQAAAQFSLAQQLTASDLLTYLADNLCVLARMVDGSTWNSFQTLIAAKQLMYAAMHIAKIWPGDAGIVASAAAGVVALPLVQLAAAFIRSSANNSLFQSDPLGYQRLLHSCCAFATALAQQVSEQTHRAKARASAQQHYNYDHCRLLLESPDFVQLLLTVVALSLRPASAAAGTAQPTSAAVADSCAQPISKAASHTEPDPPTSSASAHSSSSTSSSSSPVVGDAGNAPASSAAAAATAAEAATAADAATAAACSPEQQFVTWQDDQLSLLAALYPLSDGISWQSVLPTALDAVESLGHLSPKALAYLLGIIEHSLVRITKKMQQLLESQAGSRQQGTSSAHTQQLQPLGPVERSNLRALHVLPQLLLGAPPLWIDAEGPAVLQMHISIYQLIGRAVSCWRLEHEMCAESFAGGTDGLDLLIGELLQSLQVHIAAAVLCTSPAAQQSATAAQHSRSDTAGDNRVAVASAAAAGGADVAAPTGSASSSSSSSAAGAMQSRAEAVGNRCLLVILKILRQLATIPNYQPWQAYVTDIAAQLEQWLRSSSSSMLGNSGSTGAGSDVGRRADACDSKATTSSSKYDLLSYVMDLLMPGESRTTEGPLLLSAADAASCSQEQRQLFTLMISLTKVIVSWRAAGAAGSVAFKGAASAAADVEYVETIVCSAAYMLQATIAATSSSHSSSGGRTHGRADSSSSSSGGGGDGKQHFEAGGGSSGRSEVNRRGSSSSSEGASTAPPWSLAQPVAPWLLLLARTVVHTAGLLDTYLNYEPTDQDVVTIQTANPKVNWLRNHIRPLRTWANLTKFACDQLASALEDCCPGFSDAAVSPADNSSSSSSGFTLAVIPETILGWNQLDAIRKQQLYALLSSSLHLTCEVRAKLGQLDALFLALNPHTVDSLVNLGLKPDALAAAARAMSSESAEQLKGFFETWGIWQLQQLVCESALLVCGAIPLRWCCNNVTCMTMDGSSEWDAVNGPSCVCEGCEVARYCSKACQRAHWPQHKAMCKLIKQSKVQQ